MTNDNLYMARVGDMLTEDELHGLRLTDPKLIAMRDEYIADGSAAFNEHDFGIILELTPDGRHQPTLL
jgi:hypothetical protein